MQSGGGKSELPASGKRFQRSAYAGFWAAREPVLKLFRRLTAYEVCAGRPHQLLIQVNVE